MFSRLGLLALLLIGTLLLMTSPPTLALTQRKPIGASAVHEAATRQSPASATASPPYGENKVHITFCAA